jgi:hypothetical protein
LANFGGIRRSEKIGRELAMNLKHLEDGLWDDILPRLETLRTNPSPSEELNAAAYLAEKLLGVGPKQSRNLLQILGLTRYEVPIDSRLTKWLNEFGFPLRLSSVALSDPNYYNFVSRGIQELCKAAEVYPCILDAAIFASRDSGSWRVDNLENWAIDD